jgi:moderate conductance mechanosensitive channel
VSFNTSSIVSSLVSAGLIAIVSIILYAVVKGIITRVAKRKLKKDNGNTGRFHTLSSLLTSVAGYVIFFIAIVAILNEFGVNTSAIIASAGIVGLAIGFGAQGLVSDVVTGFFVLVEDQVNVGEYVTVGNYSGIVEETGLRLLKIRDFNGDLHFIPNREIGSLTNHSRGNKQALVDISISYDSDIDEAIQVLQAKCDELKEQLPQIVEGPNVLGVQNLGASDVVIRILARTQNGEQWAVERELRKGLKAALDQAGIEIPFPHQTVIHKKEA